MTIRLGASCAIAALSLLAACSGGGGGSGVGSGGAVPPPTGGTPTPSPTTSPSPTPAPVPNTSLLEPTVSENFTNDAANASGTFYGDARVCACNAAIRAGGVSYDAASRTYTVSMPGRSQSFGPSNLDASQSSSALSVYSRTSGSLTESLSLTRPGTSGRLTYQYVGGAYWQRVNVVGDHADVTFDAFTYGVETPDATLPRTGSANYDVDLIGVLGWGIPGALSGAGTLQADFASGVLLTRGDVDLISIETGSTIDSGNFTGAGTISSGGNLFSGGFALESIALNTLTGTLAGRFYGPTAQEIGAVFATSNSEGLAASGTLTGRTTGALSSNTSFDETLGTQFFANDASVLQMAYSASGPRSAASDQLAVNYDAATGRYTLVTPDRYRDFTTEQGDHRLTIGNSVGDPYNDADRLHYLRTGEWRARSSSGLIYEHFTFGFETPNTAMPSTGSGYYKARLSGLLTDPSQTSEPLALAGTGLVTADFAGGTVTVNGGLEAAYLPLSNRPPSVLGAFSGTAAITSGTGRFGGAFALDIFGGFNGSWSGRFYGPSAQEVGATFRATSTSGQVASGTIVGREDPSAGSSFATLASTNSTTTFDRIGSELRYGINPFGQVYQEHSIAGLGAGQPEIPGVTWNPQTGDYSIGYRGTSVGVGAADRNAAADTSALTAFHRDGADPIDVQVYRNDTGPVQLTYSSFAALTVQTTHPTYGTPIYDRYWAPFGNRTASTLMPRSGTATYSGVIFGNAVEQRSTGGYEYVLGGTSQLNVDFGLSTLDASLSINGTLVGSGEFRDFGTMQFGQTSVGSTWTARAYGGDASDPIGFNNGYLAGAFYGPNADEFGAAFGIERNTSDSRIRFGGVTIGTRTP